MFITIHHTESLYNTHVDWLCFHITSYAIQCLIFFLPVDITIGELG